MSHKIGIGIMRRSDLKQKDNLSFEIQSDEILNRAKKEGYKILEIIEDDANSAFHNSVLKRKAMKELLNKVLDDSLGISAVFFDDESRLSRQFDDFTLQIYREIKKKKPNIKFYSTSQPDEWDPYHLITAFKFANAAQESVVKSRRAKDAQKKLLHSTNEGKVVRPGSKLPFGYTMNSQDEPVPDKNASIIRLIFYLTIWGHSQETISKLLNSASIISPRNTKWSPNTIDYILNNKFYLGHLSWNVRTSRSNKKKSKGEHDLFLDNHVPLISELFWNLAHQSIQLHKEHGKNNNTPFILRDIIFCKSCNIQLKTKDNSPANSKVRYLVYLCPNCKKKIKIEDIHKEIFRDTFKKWTINMTVSKKKILQKISDKKKRIINYSKDLKDQMTKLKLNENQLLSNRTKEENNLQWRLIIPTAKKKLQKQIIQVEEFIDQINNLEKDNNLNQIFENLQQIDLTKLKHPELRTLFLVFIKKIEIDFETEEHIIMEYKLSPFVELEIFLDNIKV